MNSFTDKERFDYYWKHFALIADQRVKTFNFYILVVGATLVATVGALRPSTPRLTLFLIGLGHMFCVIVFCMIEARGKAIVRIAKKALQEFETSPAFGEGYKPMTEENKAGIKGKLGLVTYGNAFRLVFIVHFFFGAVIAFWPHLIVPYPADKLPLPTTSAGSLGSALRASKLTGSLPMFDTNTLLPGKDAVWSLVGTFIGAVLGIPAGFWVNRLSSKHADRERRNQLLAALRQTVDHNASLVEQIENQLEGGRVPTFNVDLPLFESTASMKYELLDFDLCRKIDHLRFELSHLSRKVDALLDLQANATARAVGAEDGGTLFSILHQALTQAISIQIVPIKKTLAELQLNLPSSPAH